MLTKSISHKYVLCGDRTQGAVNCVNLIFDFLKFLAITLSVNKVLEGFSYTFLFFLKVYSEILNTFFY